MNIHNCHFIGATGLYPIEEIITNTSNNLINYNILTSNNLINYTSNNILLTSNNIINYITTLTSTTLPVNNLIGNKETILGNKYNWDETILEPLNHLSSITQVQSNVIPQELDSSLFRYFYFDNNELKEARQKLTISYPNGTVAPNYLTNISYYELYKKWFGYINYNTATGSTPTGGIQMVQNDTTQIGVLNSSINISFLINLPQEIAIIWSGHTWSGMPIITAWYQGNRTFRIVYGFKIVVENGIDVPKRFITVQYAYFNNTTNTDANYPSPEDLRYYLPTGMTFEEYHYWSFNITKYGFTIYMDGNLVFTSPQIGVPSYPYYPNINNFYFGITDLRLEDNNYNLNETNFNKFQFADLYYFKKHLSANEIYSLSKYHLSTMNNTRVYGSLEVDKVICNSIYDYDYTEKKFKPLTFNISQVKGLQTDLSGKEPLLNLTPNRVIVSDPNSARGALIPSSITSNNLEDMKTLIASYNPVIEFIKDTFAADIASFVQSNPNIVTLGVSAGSALYTFITGGLNAFNANNRIPRRYITQFQDSGGDLLIYYPNLLDDGNARIYITETFKQNNIYNKQPLITGGASTITDNNLTANRVLISNGDGKVATSNNIDLVKLSYLNNVSSDIQTQINNKQPNLSVSTDSIVSIVNNIISTDWKKSGGVITYNGNGVIITSNLYVNGIAQFKSNTSIDETTAVLMIQNAFRRWEVLDTGYLKEYVSTNNYELNYVSKLTTYDYNKWIKIGDPTYGQGGVSLVQYDDASQTPANILSLTGNRDTSHIIVSFFAYIPPPALEDPLSLVGATTTCVILQGFNYSTAVFRLVFQKGLDYQGVIEEQIDLQIKSGGTWISQGYYAMPRSTSPNYISFKDPHNYIIRVFRNALSSSSGNVCWELAIDGNHKYSNVGGTLSSFQFNITNLYMEQIRASDITNNVNFHQRYNYRKMYYWTTQPSQLNTAIGTTYSATTIPALIYKYITGTLDYTVNVKGLLSCDVLQANTIMRNNQPLVYNDKTLYEKSAQNGYLTTQTGTTRRTLSIDTVRVNTTSNLINNTGFTGFLCYDNANEDATAQIRTIQIADVNTLTTSLAGKEPSFTTLVVSKGGTGKSSMTSGRLLGSTATDTYSEIQLGTGLSLSGTTLNVIGYSGADTRFTTSGTNDIYLTSTTGNMALGTSTINASYKLDVNGAVRATNLTSTDLTASSVIVCDANKKIISNANISIAELECLDGTTTNIQTNFTNTSNWVAFLRDNKANTSHTHQQSDIIGLSQSFVDTSNYVRNTSNVISDRITNLALNNISGTLSLNKGGTGKTTMTANRLLGCGATANQYNEIALGNGLTLSGTTLNSSWVNDDVNGIIYTSYGSVGVGTTLPNTGLHLHSTIIAGASRAVWLTDGATGTNTNRGAYIGKQSDQNFAIYNQEVGKLISFWITPTTVGTNVEAVRINGGGNVGIGTTANTYKLEVGGDVNITGQFRVNGTPFSGSSQWTTSGSIIYYNGGNVGIGTNNPAGRLHLHNSGLSQAVALYLSDGTSLSTGTDGCMIRKDANNLFQIYNWEAGGIAFGTSTNEVVRFDTSGNVGIGITNPSYKLHVEDGSVFIGDISYPPGGATLTTANGYILNFDNTHNGTAGSGTRANKIRLHNNGGWIAGFGIEGGAVTYHSGDNHTFYTGATGYGTERMRITTNGNVGIGHTNPQYILDIQDTTGNSGKPFLRLGNSAGGPASTVGIILSPYSARTGGASSQIWAIDDGSSSAHLAFGTAPAGTATTLSERMRILNNGNVGIGTTNPTDKLYVNGTTYFGGNCVIQNKADNWQTLLTFQNDVGTIAQFALGNSGNSVVGAGNVGFYYISSLNDYAMKLLSNGNTSFCATVYVNNNLGIGMNPPYARLHVASGSSSISGNYGFLNLSGAFGNNSTANSTICAIFESSIWSKNTVFASSDVRIKKNIQDIDDDTALQKILAIQPKKYEYINQVERGTSNVYGFIAQQIKEVIPEAITIQSEVIPNIYQLCENTSNGIYFENTSNISFSSNLDIDVISLDGKREIYKVQEYSSNYIKLDKDIENSSNVFVFGTKVDDFHALDKNYIYTLNVCATQELHRIIQRQEERIQRLENIILSFSSNI